MKHSRMATFNLKQQLSCLLARELQPCGFDVVLGFEASFKNRICTLKFNGSRKMEICINLTSINNPIYFDGSSLMFKVNYCALFAAEYIKHIERARHSVPQNYFEGLSFFNAIEVCEAKKAVSVYSPLSYWDKKPNRSYCIRPLEISSSINALNKIRFRMSSRLCQEEKLAVNTCCNRLLLYAGLPEISYVHSRVPVYALFDSLKKLADHIVSNPALLKEYPILLLAPFEKIGQMRVDELLLHCIQSDNAFLTGVSIRLIAFLHPSQEMVFSDGIYTKLVNAVNQYIEYGISYCRDIPQSGRCLQADNLYAIKTAARSINRYLRADGTGIIGGNIHFII